MRVSGRSRRLRAGAGVAAAFCLAALAACVTRPGAPPEHPSIVAARYVLQEEWPDWVGSPGFAVDTTGGLFAEAGAMSPELKAAARALAAALEAPVVAANRSATCRPMPPPPDQFCFFNCSFRDPGLTRVLELGELEEEDGRTFVWIVGYLRAPQTERCGDGVAVNAYRVLLERDPAGGWTATGIDRAAATE